MTDTEYDAFQAIVAKAKAGDWTDAQSDVLELGHAQQPAAEEVERLKMTRAKRQ
jgi:hypothetical protein